MGAFLVSLLCGGKPTKVSFLECHAFGYSKNTLHKLMIMDQIYSFEEIDDIRLSSQTG